MGTNRDWQINGTVDYLYAMARIGSNWFPCYSEMLDKAIRKYPNAYGFRFKLQINMKTVMNGTTYTFRLDLDTNVRVTLNTIPTSTTVPMDAMIRFSILF